jgi:excisionase family DNA binding protein
MLRVREAAERLKCSEALVYELCAQRRLAHVRLGLGRGTIRIRPEDLDAFISGAAVRTANPPAPKSAPVKLKHLRL